MSFKTRLIIIKATDIQRTEINRILEAIELKYLGQKDKLRKLEILHKKMDKILNSPCSCGPCKACKLRYQVSNL